MSGLELAETETQPQQRGAVDKAMALLTTLLAEGGPLRLAELARKTALPKSTVHRLIGILLSHEMIGQHGDGYVPGDRLLTHAGSGGGEQVDLLRSLAVPYLVDLYEATGSAIYLGVLCDTEVRYVDKIYGSRSVRAPSHHADRAPAHCTAIGKILLAYSHGDTRPASAELSLELSWVRQNGIAFNRGEYASGVVCTAGLVSVNGRRPLAAIAVSDRAGRMDLASTSGRVRRTALALSVAIRQSLNWTQRYARPLPAALS